MERSAFTPFALSPQLFWDVNVEQVDAEMHARFLIVRVMERGTRSDVGLVWEYYGAEKIQAALITAPSLSPETIAFFANQFSIRREAFRAFNRGSNWR